MERYIIAAGDHEIYALNPANKQKLQMKTDAARVLDIYASSSCVYHAAELMRHEFKKVDGRPKRFGVNYVQVFDSISGNPCLTVNPPCPERLPVEKRFAKLMFNFRREGDILGYYLKALFNYGKEGDPLYSSNGETGIVFEHCEPEMDLTGATFDDKRVYFQGRRIAMLDEPVRFIKEVAAEDFARSFRLRNKRAFKARKKTFFQ